MKQILLAVALLTSLISNAGTFIGTEEKGDHICYYVTEKGSYDNIIAISCVDKKVSDLLREVSSISRDLSHHLVKIMTKMDVKSVDAILLKNHTDRQADIFENQIKKITDVLTDINVNIQTINKKK